MQPDRDFPLDLLFPKLAPPACAVVLVTGPPGGGKSAWVAQQARPDDEVIDLDLIISELSGQPLYHAPKGQWLQPALEERNRRLNALAGRARSDRAFVIVCAPGTACPWWRQALRPLQWKAVVPPVWRVEDQIRLDPRRSHDVHAHLQAAADWFARNHASALRVLSRKPVRETEEDRDAA